MSKKSVKLNCSENLFILSRNTVQQTTSVLALIPLFLFPMGIEVKTQNQRFVYYVQELKGMGTRRSHILIPILARGEEPKEAIEMKNVP